MHQGSYERKMVLIQKACKCSECSRELPIGHQVCKVTAHIWGKLWHRVAVCFECLQKNHTGDQPLQRKRA